MLVLFLSCLIVAAPHFTDATPVCRDEAFGRRICSLESNPVITKIVNERVFVGVTNALHVFQPDLSGFEVVDLSSDPTTVTSCTGLGFPSASCRNFIRTIDVDPDDSDRVLVCGTNALLPHCNVHQASDVSNYYNLTSTAENDAGYSPYSSDVEITSLLASNRRFFSATRFFRSDFKTSLRMSLNPLGGNTEFSVITPDDNNWLDQPMFVSVHEHDDYIYFFLRETALEVSAFLQTARYSRVIRICKRDVGLRDTNRFLTFQKARITCSVEGNGIPFFYDHLESTFLYEANGTSVLYATFNAQMNGPAGGAICKYVFDPNADNGIIDVFEDKDYLVQDDSMVRTPFVEVIGTPFVCPGSQGTQRPEDEAEYLLKADAIEADNEHPLFISASEFLDKITTEMIQYGQDSQEIVYFTTLQGDIKQAIFSSANEGKQYVHTLYKSTDDSKVKDLILRQGSNDDERSLIAGISNAIMLIPRGQCSSYTSCFSCFDSRDAYCGWDTVLKSCENKLSSDLATLIQSFSANESVITGQCGKRPPTPSTTDENPDTPCSVKPTTAPRNNGVTTDTDEKEEIDCTTKTVPNTPITSKLALGGSGGVSIGAVVGAALAAFVVGVPVGGLVCVLFYSKVLNRNKDSDDKDSSPETPREPTVNSTDGNGPKINNQDIVKPEISKNSENTEKNDLSKPTLKPAPPPRYTPHKPPGLGQPNGVKPTNTVTPPAIRTIAPPPPPTTVPSEYETPKQSNGKILTPTASLPSMFHHPTSTNRSMSLSRQQTLPETLPEVSEIDDNAFADHDTLPPLRTFHHHPGTMHGSLPRMKTRSNGVSRKQVPGYKTPRGRTESTTWLRQRSESLSSDISSNTSPLQSPISDV